MKIVVILLCEKVGLACDYKMADFNDIYNKLVPFFNKYPLYGTKLLNLNKFKQAAGGIIKHKEHLTQQGLTKLQAINSARLSSIPSSSNPPCALLRTAKGGIGPLRLIPPARAP